MTRWLPIMTALSLLIAPLSAVAAPLDGPEVGIWANVCSGGPAIWIDLSGGDEEPAGPPASHNTACHAVCCQRGDDDDDGTGCAA